jgi:hypothetical protein
MQHQQPLGNVDTTIGVDPDQVVVEGDVVDLRQDDAVGDDRLAEQLVGVRHDVGRVQQMIVRQVADRAPVIMDGEHAVPDDAAVTATVVLTNARQPWELQRVTTIYNEQPERPRRIADAKAILLGPCDRA